MFERIMGILTLKAPTYKAVAEDQKATQEAMIIVIAVAILNGIVSMIVSMSTLGRSFIGGLLGAVVNVIFGLIIWYVGAWVLAFVAKQFGGKTDTGEMLRVTGYVYVFNIVNVLTVLAAFSSALVCVTLPISIVAWVLGVIGYVIGVREAAEFSTQNAVITAVIAFVIVIIVGMIGGAVVGAVTAFL